MTPRIALGALAALALAAACKPKALPEVGSPAAQVYISRCGTCHRPYNPASMTAAMWQAQVVAMDRKIAAAGRAPLSPSERRQVLDYLQRNAGTQ